MRRYLGIIGDPIQHTLSPAMHNAALQVQGLAYTYLPFQVHSEDLRVVLAGMKAMGFSGFNVTIPHKVAIIAHLDEISAEARLIGAVNTVHLQAGRWIGYNTDGSGFLRSLKEDGEIDPKDRRVLVLGAGGAARAVAVQLGLAEAKEVILANRTLTKAQKLAEELQNNISGVCYRSSAFTKGAIAKEIMSAEIIVNATPIGMEAFPEQEFPLSAEWFRPDQIAYDLVYRPKLTPFLQLATQAGLRIVTGDSMLLYQGVEAYRIWTGIEPPVEVMRSVLLEQLG